MVRRPSEARSTVPYREDDTSMASPSDPARIALLTPAWAAALVALVLGLSFWAGEPTSGPAARSALVGAISRVHTLAFSPDGSTVTAADVDGPLTTWKVASARRCDDPAAGIAPSPCAVLAPDGSTLAVVEWDGTISLRDVATHLVRATLPACEKSFHVPAFSRDGALLATADSRSVRLWDAATGTERPGGRFDLPRVLRMAFGPGGRTLAAGCLDGSIHLLDLDAGRERLVIRAHDGFIGALAFAEDGRTLASVGTGDDLAQVWDVGTGRRLAPLRSEVGLLSLAFAPGGRSLASGCIDGSVRLWDTATGRATANLLGHEDAVHALAFSTDGRTLASGDADGGVRLWDLTEEPEAAGR